MLIFSYLFSAVQSASHACSTLSKAVGFFFMGEPASHTANQQHATFSVVNYAKKTVYSWGKAFKDFFLGKVKALPFEQAVRNHHLLKGDYAFCAAENNKDMARAVVQLHLIYAQVACLFRAGFMPIEPADPVNLVTSGETMRHKHQSPEEKELLLFYSSNTHNDLLQISRTINNMSVKVVLNSSIEVDKLGISTPLSHQFKQFKNPFDIYSYDDYNSQAESILVKISVVLAKMHGSRGVDVSHLVSRADILSELVSSFKSLLKLDENLHYNIAYRNYLSHLKVGPPDKLKLESSDFLDKFCLYILMKYREKAITTDEYRVADSDSSNSINIEATIRESVVRKKQTYLETKGAELRKGREQSLKEFLNIGTGIPKKPVVMFSKLENNDFGSKVSMPATVHLDNQIVCVNHGNFYNNRMLHPILRVLAKSGVDAKLNIGPAKTIAAHLAYGPNPPINYQLITNRAPDLKKNTPSQIYSMYNTSQRCTDYTEALMRGHYAITSGNLWAMLQLHKSQSDRIDLRQLHGAAMVGDLWKFKNFYGLALHIGRCRLNSKLDEPSAERAWINRSYAKFLFSSRETDYRYRCLSKILIDHKSLIAALNYSDDEGRINMATGQVDLGPILSEMALGILGFQYHFFLIELEKELEKGGAFPIRGADLEYFAFLKEFALYFLDKQFCKEFSDMGENPDNALDILKAKVINTNLRSKAQYIHEMIESERTALQEFQGLEDNICLNNKDKEILFILSQFLQSTPTNKSIKVSDLQDYYYSQMGYQFVSSTSLRQKLDNILSQRSSNFIIDLLKEDLEGYQSAIQVLSDTKGLKRPKDLQNFFFQHNLVNEEFKKTISDIFVLTEDLKTGASNASASTTSEEDLDGAQTEKELVLERLYRQAESYHNYHWYTLDAVLETLPPQLQNQVFISMLGLVKKMVEAPNSAVNPLSNCLYYKHKPESKSKSISEFKDYLISQSKDLEFTMSLESEEIVLVDHL